MLQTDMEKLEAGVADFLSKVPSIQQPERCHFELPEFLDKKKDAWRKQAGMQGIYYLHSGDGVVYYVGEAIRKYGVGYRVRQNAARHELIDRPGVRVGLILFDEPDLPWALALEEFLIRDVQPQHNTAGKSRINPK